MKILVEDPAEAKVEDVVHRLARLGYTIHRFTEKHLGLLGLLLLMVQRETRQSYHPPDTHSLSFIFLLVDFNIARGTIVSINQTRACTASMNSMMRKFIM